MVSMVFVFIPVLISAILIVSPDFSFTRHTTSFAQLDLAELKVRNTTDSVISSNESISNAPSTLTPEQLSSQQGGLDQQHLQQQQGQQR